MTPEEQAERQPERQPDAYSQIIRKTWDEYIPFRVLWELTYRCNERCRHCYIVDRDGRGELTTQEAYRVLDELAQAGTLYVTFTGGEILVRDDFSDIARYARKQAFAIRILTNGTLITPRVADEIKALHPMAVEISIYSTRPEVHDEITNLPGSFDRSLRALRLLHERGVKVKVKSPLMERTMPDFEDLRALADQFGGDFNYDTTLVPADDGSDRPLHEAMQAGTLHGFYTRYLDGWRAREPEPEHSPCNSGINIATIDPYGNVNPCIQLRLAAGNLREQSFGQIWRESPLLRRMRGMTVSELHDCQGCELLPFCVRCPGVVQLETGDLIGCSQVARMDATARRAALDAKGIVPEPGGPPPDCEE